MTSARDAWTSDRQYCLAGTLFKDGVVSIFGFCSKTDFVAAATTCRYWYSVATVTPSLRYSFTESHFDAIRCAIRLRSPLLYHIGVLEPQSIVTPVELEEVAQSFTGLMSLTAVLSLTSPPRVCRFSSRLHTLHLEFDSTIDPPQDAVRTVLGGIRQCTPMLQRLLLGGFLAAEVNLAPLRELQSLTLFSMSYISSSLNLEPLRSCTSLATLEIGTRDRKVRVSMLEQLSQMTALKTLTLELCVINMEDLAHLHPPALNTLSVGLPTGGRPAPTYWRTLFQHAPGLTALNSAVSPLEVNSLIDSFVKLRALMVIAMDASDRAKLNQPENEAEFAYAIRQLPSLTCITFNKWACSSIESWNTMLPVGTSIEELDFGGVISSSESISSKAILHPLCNLSKSSAASQLCRLYVSFTVFHEELRVVMEYFRRMTSLRNLSLTSSFMNTVSMDRIHLAFDDATIMPQLEHLEITGARWENGHLAPFEFNRASANSYRINRSATAEHATSIIAPAGMN